MSATSFLVWFLTISALIKRVSAERNETDGKDKKILILGAGMSGISAAKTLHDHGYTNIEILEGTDRVGGRVKSENLSGYTVELGAQWIYGAGTNPILKLANEYKFDYKLNSYTWTLRDALGNDLTERGVEEYEKLETALANLAILSETMRQNDTSDMTTESLLRFCGWRPDTIVADAIEVTQIDIDNGREAASLSGKYMYHYEVNNEHGDDSLFIVNDTRGFVYIIERLMESFLSKGDKRLVLNKKVNQIANWDGKDSNIKVYSDDGTVFEADYVIVTFSVGVLQSRHVVFKPSLPDWKLLAIDKFGFGQYQVINLKFKTAFWDNTTYIIHVAKRRGEHCLWFNMNLIFPGCNILQLHLAASEAKAADRMGDSELSAKAINVLRSMYPHANISEPENVIASRWISDPLTLGAFSYWTPGFTQEDMDDLGQRVGNMYFAGEHINKTNFGYLHSAYTSGINTAMELMTCIEDNTLCKHRASTKEASNVCTSDGYVMTQHLYLVFVVLIIVVQIKNLLP